MASIISAGTTSATALNMSADTSGVLQLSSNNGTTAVTIDTSQRVGVGTTTPAFPLDVNTTIQDSANFASSNANMDIYLKASGTTSGFTRLRATGGDMVFITGLNERMRIDSSGRVTTPYQPAFMAGTAQNDFTINSGAIFPFDVTSINVGGHYNTSTYKFTAPVAGLYQMMWMCFYTNSGGFTNIMNTAPAKNDVQIIIADDAIMGAANPNDCGGQICVGGSAIVSLAANDTLSLFARGSNIRIYGGHSFFSAYLIG